MGCSAIGPGPDPDREKMVFIEREPEKQTALLLRMLLLLFSMQITILYDLRTLKRIFEERKGLQSLDICPILHAKPTRVWS